MKKETKTKAELTCLHNVGIVCKSEGRTGTYGECRKCGWDPDTETRRKRAYRLRLIGEALKAKRKQEAERKAPPAKHEDCASCRFYKAM